MMNKTIKKYPEVTPKNIWNFRQNNPELIIKDAEEYIGLDKNQSNILRTILLSRGVNKWLKVRRDLIAYKILIKLRITEIQRQRSVYKEEKNWKDRNILKQELKTLEIIRKDLRKMCHSDRYVIWRHSVSRKVLREMNTIKVGVQI